MTAARKQNMDIRAAAVWSTVVSIVVVVVYSPRTHERLRQCIPKQCSVVEIGVVVRDVDAFPTT